MATEAKQITSEQLEDAKTLAQETENRQITEADIAKLEERITKRMGRKTAAERWNEAVQRLDVIKHDPVFGRAWRADNEKLKNYLRYGRDLSRGIETRDIAPAAGTVFSPPTLATLSVQYANEDYIGEDLCPAVTVARRTGNYPIYGQGDRLQYPDDLMIGDRGHAAEIQETRVQGTYTCQPRGFSNYVTQQVIDNEDAPLDEMVDVVQAIAEGLLFKREVRIANLLCTAAGYGVNTAAIVAASRWNSAGGGNPVLDLQTAEAAVWQGHGPGRKVGFTSITVFNVLARHPAILELFKYTGSSPGLATPQMIAGFFGLDDLKVGRARQNATAEGAVPAYTRIWEPGAAFFFGVVRVPTKATIRNAGFALTFRQGNPLTSVLFEAQSGHGGGYRAQTSVMEVQQVIAAPTGYLITTPIN